MPLTVLLPLVVFGIGGIVVLIRLMRPTPVLAIDGEDSARRIWNHRNHETPAEKLLINPAHSHALIETGAGPGILWAFGADPVTRLLNHPFDCQETRHGLRIVTHDFTAPAIDIPLPQDLRAGWLDLLKGLAT